MNASLVNDTTDDGTLQKWAWFFIDKLSYLENKVVSVSMLICFSIATVKHYSRFARKIGLLMILEILVLSQLMVQTFESKGKTDEWN